MSRRLASSTVPAALMMLVAVASSARAQQDRSFSPQIFHPAPGPDAFITVETAQPLPHKGYALGLTFNWARNQFSIFGFDKSTGTTTGVRANLIGSALGADVWAAFGLGRRFQVALALPMMVYQTGQSFDDVNPPPDGTHVRAPNGFAFGDPRLHLKALVYGKPARGAQIAVSYWQGFPFGNDQQFGGEKHFSGFSGEPRLLVGWEQPFWRLGLFAGLLWRAHVSQFFSTIVGSQLTYGGAFSLGPIRNRLWLIVEAYGHSNSIDRVAVVNGGKSSITDINDNPLEADLAAKVRIVYGLTMHVGVGTGIIGGLGAPEPRVFAGATWAPNFADRDGDGVPDNVDRCPDQPEDRDGFKDDDGCPDPDNDSDTIPDTEDKCPNEAEDFDGFQDDDGCPDPDNDKDGIDDLHDACPNDPEDHKPPKPNDGCPASKTDTDGDGIPDSVDKCPNDPEDKDGFQDDDGCPDPDNDNDGIPDSFDQCPNEPEDMDGFQDEDGCPDPDNDKDGIPDKLDKCPDEPETINGYQDEDGCPDTGPAPKARLDLKTHQIVILDKVFFDTNKSTIKPVSFGLLDQVAQILRGHSEIKVEIQGHTDAQGNMDRNIALSKERAESVRTYLIKKGVDPARLISGGYGPTVPIADNRTKAGREANRRVEFHIVDEPKSDKKPAGDGDGKAPDETKSQ